MTQSYLMQQATLEGIGNRLCFISVPQKWTSLIKPCILPTFLIESASTYATIVSNWAGELHSYDDNKIIMNNVMLKNNGFEDGEAVYITQLPTPSPCLSVFAQLNSNDDWDNLVLNYEIIQTSMLDQVRVVKIGQIIPLWLEGGCFVLIKILRFGNSANSTHTLTNDTTINIAPFKMSADNQEIIPTDKLLTTVQSDNLSVKLCKDDTFKLVTALFRKNFPQVYGNCLPKNSYIYEILSFRRFPENVTDSLIKQFKCHPALIIVSKSIVEHSVFETCNWFLLKIQCGKAGNINIERSINSEDQSIAVCLAIIWENFSMTTDLYESEQRKIVNMVSVTSCIVSDPLWTTLGLSFSDIIQLHSANVKVTKEIPAIDFCPISNVPNINDIISAVCIKEFITTMCTICPVVLNATNVVSIAIKDHKVQVLLMPKNKHVTYIDKISCSLASFQLISKPADAILSEMNNVKTCVILPKVNDIKSPANIVLYCKFFNKLIAHIKNSLTSFDLKSPFMLLEGSERTGKTTIAYNIADHMQDSAIYCKQLKLKLLSGKKSDTLQKILLKDMHLCLVNQPSILILDDIDYLIPSHSSDNQDEGTFHEYVIQLATMLKNIISQVSKAIKCKEAHKLKFIIMGICKSRSDINSVLYTPNGHNLFPIVFKVPSLNYEEKMKFIFHCIDTSLGATNTECKDDTCFNFIQDQLKGTIQSLSLPELQSFARRVVIEAKSRSEYVNNSKAICEEDFIKACRDMIPLSIKEINKQDNKSEKYVIGGLHEPKCIIKRSILWPLHHPQIFSQVGLNVRTGILLYGPPGCGKTLLAKYIATSCNLNFIFVKGPQLLSKYIGKSEKSVRDIFSRCRNASPCIIFFDEFDALAPRRGHDNTGVTDRVVNQLLTQMDGVEGNDGVTILAATSRPDLIDPALLRPGRLDKHVYCPIPDERERALIFEALSTHLRLAEDIDWKNLASLTNQLTGADIQGILSTAQVFAAQEILGQSLYDGLNLVGHNSNESVQRNEDVRCASQATVRKQHILEAINTTKKSISTIEMKKYHDIYRKFDTNNDSKGAQTVFPGIKYTLA